MTTKKEIYLDNNATTPIAPEVFDAMLPYLKDQYGNPSSLHYKGIMAERAIKEARNQIAGILKVQAHEIIFTSCGTESNNLAIKGIARALQRKGKHIITTAIEHEAVLSSCKQLAQEGFEISYVKPQSNGEITADAIGSLIREDTILVALMHVNNELGTVIPIAQIAKAIKNWNPKIVVYSDGVQGFGKLDVNLQHIDAYALSGHKIHAPKGVAALFIRENTPLFSLISGGGQEFGTRSGTENVGGIVALAKAAKLAVERLQESREEWRKLKLHFVTQLEKIFPSASVNSPRNSLENVVNISFLGIPSEVMMHSLEQRGIYVSAGSACGGMKRESSYVLKAMGLSKEQIQSAIRFSFSRYNTMDEIIYTLGAIANISAELEFIRK